MSGTGPAAGRDMLKAEANDVQDRPFPPAAPGFPAPLIDGYRAFLAGRFGEQQARYRALAQAGQTPSVMVIACCDSRAAPETIFDAGPGELFVVRNVANLVPPFEPDGGHHSTSAALEFAIEVLRVKHVVVMGHGRCGGIAAALNPDAPALSPGDFIGRWMSLLKPAAEAIAGSSWLTPAERQTALERVSVRHSVANLRTFPYVREREARGEIALHGAWFDIATGELWVMEPDGGSFVRPGIDVLHETG